MAKAFVDAKIRGDKVVVFLKPRCPYCVLAQDVLSQYAFREGHLECVDISGRSDMSSLQDYFLERTGARTVPRVFIGEECIGGGSDVSALHRSGRLQEKLKAVGALQ